VNSAPATATDSELGHVRVLDLPLGDIHPAPENDQLYRPVNTDDPEIIKLAESIEVHGVQECPPPGQSSSGKRAVPGGRR